MTDWFISSLPTITPLGGLLALSVWVVRQIATGRWMHITIHQRIVDTMTEAGRVRDLADARRDAQFDKLIGNDETVLHLLRSIAPPQEDKR